MNIQKLLRKVGVASVLAVSCALLAPAAFAGGHGRGDDGYRYRDNHVERGYRDHVRYRGEASFGYRYAPVRYYSRPAYGYAGGRYDHDYRRRGWHDHDRGWRVGGLLGAVVAGAVITNLITNAIEPRTTVVERTVYRDDPRQTRYLGSDDDGYYGDPRR